MTGLTLLETLQYSLNDSFYSVGTGFVEFLPKLIIALLLFVAGWVVGVIFAQVVERVISALKIDKLLAGAGMDKVMARTGLKLNSGMFLGELIKWFTIIVFLVASFEVLGLNQVNDFLQGVVIGYIPQLIAAVLILVAAVILAEFMRKLVVASAKASHLKSANFLGAVTKWAIWVFAIITALFQVGIAPAIFQSLFNGIVIAMSLAIGLSFGLGGKDVAASFLKKLSEEMSERS